MVAEQGLVLVVEDDAQIQEVVRLVLEDEGIASIKAGTAREALALLAERRPAVMLLDLGLPDVDVTSVASVAAAGRAAGARVVICSAAGRGAEDLAERIDGDAYLAKPFDIEDLAATVRRRAPGGGGPGVRPS